MKINVYIQILHTEFYLYVRLIYVHIFPYVT